MNLWYWDIVRPIRTYFARRRRSRWKQNWSKGNCPSCKLPFDNGKKRCVVDSCGHDRCYSCLCSQDACPICIRDAVAYQSTKKYSRNNEKAEKRKSNEMTMRALLNITNEPSLGIPQEMGPSGIYQKGQQLKRHSHISNANEDFSFDKLVSSLPECFLTLKPLYFEVPQPENENAFLYREWVFQEISKVLSSNKKGVVLVGDEGCGKTTLILQLVDWSSFGRKRKSGIISEGVISDIATFESLASKVVGYHFCQDDCSETCLIPDFVHSLAAQLCQAPQLSEYKNFLVQNISCQQLLSLDNCIRDPDTAFQKGILNPLCSLKNCSLTSELLVIDSVHEAEVQPRSITSFLASHIEEFPTWLKVVLTVNTTDVNIVCSLPLHRINLDSSELKVKDDLIRYTRCRISKSPAIQANISAFGDEGQISRFIQHLVNGGQASFLFIRLVLDLFQQNYLVIKSSTFNVIPVSLDEVFTLTFNLKFPSTATFNKVKPILEICLTSLSPLTALEIFYTLISSSLVPTLKWYDFTEILRSLHGVLIQRKDESLMIFHPALRNWLKQNKKFFCDIGLGHAYHALLPTRMHFSLSKEKELELIYHLSSCCLFKEKKQFQALWLQNSSMNSTKLLINLRTIFWADPKVIHLLLQSGADANATFDNHNKSTIFSEACRLGSLEVVSFLLQFGAYPDKTNALGVTPLMEASETGQMKTVEKLLNSGAKVHLQDNIGRCALSNAAEKGCMETIKLLIQPNNWSSPILRSQAIQRALVAASGSKNFQVCEYLLKTANTSVNQLKVACAQSQTAVCKLSLNSSLSDPENLRLAAFRGHISILQALTDKEIDWNTKDVNGRSALAWACTNHQYEAAKFLLERGADVNSKDNQQLMPIHLAAVNGNAEMITLLLKYSADPECTNNGNQTALECAIATQNSSTTMALLKRGSKIREKVFECAEEQPHLYSSLLCKVLSDGIALIEEGNFTEASQRLEHGLRKSNKQSFQRLHYQFQEKLEQCNKMKNRNSMIFLPENKPFGEFQEDFSQFNYQLQSGHVSFKLRK